MSLNLCKCGHIESGHIVVRPDVTPPAPYRGFCIIDADCPCQRYVPSGTTRSEPLAPDVVASRKSAIEKMLADAAAAVSGNRPATPAKPKPKTPGQELRDLLAEEAGES